MEKKKNARTFQFKSSLLTHGHSHISLEYSTCDTCVYGLSSHTTALYDNEKFSTHLVVHFLQIVGHGSPGKEFPTCSNKFKRTNNNIIGGGAASLNAEKGVLRIPISACRTLNRTPTALASHLQWWPSG